MDFTLNKGSDFLLRQGERIEPLGGGFRVIVNDLHHFSTDTILLADFSANVKAAKAADLGTGCGTIPLIWAKRNAAAHIDAVEIQQEAADMLRRSAELNALEDKITVINRDMRELRGVLELGSYNLVCCNPPYKHEGSGIVNPDGSKAAARHEFFCTIDDVTAAASSLLQFGGRFCICQRPERLTDILLSMRAHGLEPKRLRMVQQRKSKAPKLFLAEGRKGGKTGFMSVEPTLFIEDENGNFSPEMLNIYGDYKG